MSGYAGGIQRCDLLIRRTAWQGARPASPFPPFASNHASRAGQADGNLNGQRSAVHQVGDPASAPRHAGRGGELARRLLRNLLSNHHRPKTCYANV